ncbi:MAG: asparagine synthase-related protein [bacterium]
MPYLLGAFGAHCTPDLIKKLSHIALQQTPDGALETMLLDNGIIFAGYKHDEAYHYDRIIPIQADQEIHGILVGKLFNRDNHEPVNFNHINLNNNHIQACINNPKNLSTLFWGRYIGTLFNKTTKTITLVRDPQGLSTLFYHVTPDGVIFSTELILLYKALDIKPAVNINYFAQHIIHTNHALSSTPFDGIEELLPGIGLSINSRGKCTHDVLWDAASIQSSFISDENKLEEELLATLKACTKAWVGDAPGVCVELSGGTDSSGVMLLLHDILPVYKKLIAVNYIDSKTQSSNEIEFAQETADACNAQVHFLDWQTTSLLDKLPQNFFPNRPSTLLLFYNLRQQLQDIAMQNNCPEVMNGQGGDHVFLAPPPKLALADYWLDHKFNGVTTPLKELSGIYRMPWLSLAHENAKAVASYYCKKRHKETTEKNDQNYLDKNFVQELKQQEFYLNNTLRKIHPGKASQIESIYHAVSYCERNWTTPGTCITHPLLSQPIIELSLKIPTYQSFNDGYDRIFFRRAISQLKKTKSLWRRIKGQTTGTMVKQCAHHAHDIRNIILNGKLAASGMLNTQLIDEQITKAQHGQVESLWPILHILTGQLWLDKWGL